MKYCVVVLSALLLLYGCGGGEEQKLPSDVISPEVQGKEDPAPDKPTDSTDKKPEEALLQVLSVLGYTKCGVRMADEGVVVSYVQSGVTSDIDVYVAWNAIAFAAAEIYPQKTTIVIETFLDKELVMISEFPTEKVLAFSRNEITEEEYRKAVGLHFIPEINISKKGAEFLKNSTSAVQ